VHELSIARSLVGLVLANLPAGAARVTAVELRLGALAGVARGALEFCYDVATAGTPLQGSTLRVVELPVVIHCPACGVNRTLDGLAAMRCATCGTPSADVRQGRELDLAAIEYDVVEDAAR
jgi:hydrogenase nickel incorporation protein HypA/HybF